MDMHTQIWKLAAIRASRSFMIAIPIIVIYWQSHGLSIQDIFILQVVFSLAVVVFEIPTGYLADRFGKKTSLVLGAVCWTLGFLLYYAIPSYFGFIVAELTLALASGLISGADTALLYETLKTHKREGLYQKYQGRLLATSMVSEAVAAVLAGVVVALFSIKAVLLVQWVVVALTIPLSLSLKEVKTNVKEKTPTLLAILRGSFRENERLRYLNVYAGALSAATLTMMWFVQPHWQVIGVDIIYFGYLFAVLHLTVAFGAVIAHKVEGQLRFRTLFGIMAVMPLALYLSTGMLNASLLSLLVIPLFWLLRGVSSPIISGYVQRECKDNERATVLSINALVSRVIFSVFSPFLGWVADVWDLGTAFLASGVIFGVLSIVSFVFLYGAIVRNPRTS